MKYQKEGLEDMVKTWLESWRQDPITTEGNRAVLMQVAHPGGRAISCALSRESGNSISHHHSWNGSYMAC